LSDPSEAIRAERIQQICAPPEELTEKRPEMTAKATVYTLPSCVQCDSTKRLMTREHIEFDVVDLSTDEKAMEFVRSLGYSAAPVVVAGDKHWSGFKLDQIMGLAS
jgi:glutaredoxin-like protein NrdH